MRHDRNHQPLKALRDDLDLDIPAIVRALREVYGVDVDERKYSHFERTDPRHGTPRIRGLDHAQVEAVMRRLHETNGATGRPAGRLLAVAREAAAAIPYRTLRDRLADAGVSEEEFAEYWSDSDFSLPDLADLVEMDELEVRELAALLDLDLSRSAPDAEPAPVVEDATGGAEYGAEVQTPVARVQSPARPINTRFATASRRKRDEVQDFIDRWDLDRDTVRALYDTRPLTEIVQYFGISQGDWYVVLGLFNVPLHGNARPWTSARAADFPPRPAVRLLTASAPDEPGDAPEAPSRPVTRASEGVEEIVSALTDRVAWYEEREEAMRDALAAADRRREEASIALVEANERVKRLEAEMRGIKDGLARTQEALAALNRGVA